MCAANRAPISYELTPATAANVLLVEELLAEARLGDGAARKLFGDLAYRGKKPKEVLAAERAERRPATRQQVEVCLASLKHALDLGATPARTPAGPAVRIAAKLCSYTYGLYINRLLGWAFPGKTDTLKWGR